MNKPTTADRFQALRDHLSNQGGHDYWRSLEELSESPEFREFLEREFPRQAGGWIDAGRREFLKLMAASLALAGAGGCLRQPDEDIVPYVRQPEQIVPGNALYYATAMTLGGFAKGVTVKSMMGRPIKVEGNPRHPDSLGATDIFGQASVLSLYDPDRSQTPLYRQNIDTWQRFLATMSREAGAMRRDRGRGLRFLTPTVTSPTQARLIAEIVDDLAEAQWHQYEPINRDSPRSGSELAFGRVVETVYEFDRADVVLSLDGDFFFAVPGSLRYARDFMDRRRVASGARMMNRLYVAEPTPSLAGTRADHRLALKSRDVEALARVIAARIGVLPADQPPTRVAGVPQEWIAALADDLLSSRSRSLIYVGASQPPVVHALAHAMNWKLGNVDHTVRYIEPVEARPVDQRSSLEELTSSMRAGEVRLLVILGGNPVYDAPVDFDFRQALSKVDLAAHLSDRQDETSFFCHWHLPAAHWLEAWDDARAFDGTASIIQPLIAPLYAGRTASEILSIFHAGGYRSAHELVQATWRQRFSETDFAHQWQESLHEGMVDDSQSAAARVEPRFDKWNLPTLDADGSTELEISFRPDESIWDGRFANNGWLQELPKPVSKLVWDNAALVGPATAERLGLATNDVVDISTEGGTLRAAVWVLPGQADGAVTLSLGYGRTRAGRIGNGLGFNAYALRTAHALRQPMRAELRRVAGATYQLVGTQNHGSMEGRDIVRETTLAALDEPASLSDGTGGLKIVEPTLYPAWPSSPHAWGMSIDQTACMGCNACVVACAAENNTPIVGKSEVAKGREMNWLRIDRYFRGELDNPSVSFQPMFCVHCELAPCELVCPVGATLHDSEGLNQMVYNRCVGTRYCSNNCPYKVRHFNFFMYSDQQTPSLKLMRNPEVTVRARGVMEKCTYCIQRIQGARIAAELENRALRDGDVVTACQAACPTRAIVFGDTSDPQSDVSKLKRGPLDYSVLGELGTRPRTTHLTLVRNPNPRLTIAKKHPGSAAGESVGENPR